MKPPICAVCGARLETDSGGLVTFARAPKDDAWCRRAAEPGFAGHPPNQDWFCEAHRGPAEALADRTLGEALRALRPGGA